VAADIQTLMDEIHDEGQLRTVGAMSAAGSPARS
jgi:hypothetical protein